jgi:hypothetical protein
MTTVTYYNQAQLARDLRMIADFKGKRKAHGFYSRHVFKRGSMTITNCYTIPCTLSVLGEQVDLTKIATNSNIAVTIMQLALAAEAVRNNMLNIDTSWNYNYNKLL